MGKKINRVGKIPVFIKKLKDILDDKNFEEIILWLPQGNGFQILNNGLFTQKVLPQYFKHQNLSSFIRQLNMYGFSRPKDSGNNTYMHPRFSRKNLNNMKFIKRKQTSTKNNEDQISSQQICKQKYKKDESKQKFMDSYKLLQIQNEELKKQNKQLHLRLDQYQQMLSKIKLYTNNIENWNASLDNQNQADKQSIQANSSTDQSISSINSQSKKGFSIYSNSSCRPYYEQSYQILLKGTNKNQGEK